MSGALKKGFIGKSAKDLRKNTPTTAAKSRSSQQRKSVFGSISSALAKARSLTEKLLQSADTSPEPVTDDDGMLVNPEAALVQWLTEVMLLEHLPFEYLVPAGWMLPGESIRFFRLDRSWLDCFMDGALSVLNLGPGDMENHAAVVRYLRKRVDSSLNKLGARTGELSGMLIRSELVTRWPNMEIRAFSSYDKKAKVAILRRARVAPSILLVIFGGVPERLEIQEPFEGLRFGVDNDGSTIARDDEGKSDKKVSGFVKSSGKAPDILMWVQPTNLQGALLPRSTLQATVNLQTGAVSSTPDPNTKVDSSRLALSLQQGPYCHEVAFCTDGGRDDSMEYEFVTETVPERK